MHYGSNTPGELVQSPHAVPPKTPCRWRLGLIFVFLILLPGVCLGESASQSSSARGNDVLAETNTTESVSNLIE